MWLYDNDKDILSCCLDVYLMGDVLDEIICCVRCIFYCNVVI